MKRPRDIVLEDQKRYKRVAISGGWAGMIDRKGHSRRGDLPKTLLVLLSVKKALQDHLSRGLTDVRSKHLRNVVDGDERWIEGLS